MKKARSLLTDALFEIGCEELPATNLADIFESSSENPLETRLKKILDEKRIAFGECRVFATPRRLVFWMKDLAPAQAAKDNLIRLLSKQEAYAADGSPAEKFLTILRHRNASVKDTVVSEQNGKEFVFIRKAEPVRKTAAVLPEICAALVKSLAFPKNMRWGKKWEDGSDLYFPRPIRNFLCLYGSQALKFKIAGIPVSGKTMFFSKGCRRPVVVASLPAYFKALKLNGVILDPVERKKTIQQKLEALAARFKGRFNDDPFLMNEVNFLVEDPQPLSASFKEKFLELPAEVLAVSMSRKQRIFGMTGPGGKVAPRFLGVMDGAHSQKEKAAISSDYEHILHAKLQDSLFFYKEDMKISLEKKRQELKDLIFLKGAGSMLDKSERLVRLAKHLAPKLGFSPAQAEALSRACYLSKADLLTQMVGEFPELQGIMGKYYALAQGESGEAAQAIGEQYLPRTVSDHLPESRLGGLLSLLDKCDLIAACFALSLEPTSSLDPYGLRRSATAVLKIIIDKELRFSLPEFLRHLVSAELKHFLKSDPAAVEMKLGNFFKERLKALLADRYDEDLTEAAMGSSFGDVRELQERLLVLSKLKNRESFARACKVVERTVNILKGNKEPLAGAVDRAFLAEEVEKRVFEHYERTHAAIREAARSRDFELATSLYAEAFFDILGEFFEKVFVNSDDKNVRQNRLTLLDSIKRLYTDDIADLSKVRLS